MAVVGGVPGYALAFDQAALHLGELFLGDDALGLQLGEFAELAYQIGLDRTGGEGIRSRRSGALLGFEDDGFADTALFALLSEVFDDFPSFFELLLVYFFQPGWIEIQDGASGFKMPFEHLAECKRGSAGEGRYRDPAEHGPDDGDHLGHAARGHARDGRTGECGDDSLALCFGEIYLVHPAHLADHVQLERAHGEDIRDEYGYEAGTHGPNDMIADDGVGMSRLIGTWVGMAHGVFFYRFEYQFLNRLV